jgi:hypothetical protein
LAKVNKDGGNKETNPSEKAYLGIMAVEEKDEDAQALEFSL